LQTYSKKLIFVYHNFGINTFEGVPMLQTHFCLPQYRHQPFCVSANVAYLQRDTHFNLPPFLYQHYWGLSLLKTHFCLPQFRHQHLCGSANVANLQRETHFILPHFGINTFGGLPVLQTYSEKLTSFYHISASTLLGGVPMLQTYRKKLP
jgi:hypothetical protein